MKTELRGRDFISLLDFNKEELETIFDCSMYFKTRKAVGQGDSDEILKGKNIGLFFASPSTRTRFSFMSGIAQLGGTAQVYSPAELQLKNKESWKDTAEMITRYLDGFCIRLYNLKVQMGADSYTYGDARKVLREIARQTRMPIINMLDDLEHPCQIMADILTIKEKFPDEWKTMKVVMSWAPDVRAKSPGVPQTFAVAAGILGMNCVIASPNVPGCYDIDPAYLKAAQEAAKKSGGSVTIEHDVKAAAKGAKVIYCKSFARDPEKHAEIWEKYREEWIISHKHFEEAAPGAVFMHCLPAHRNFEVTDALIDDEKISIVNDQAENRLHVQKAIMALTMR